MYRPVSPIRSVIPPSVPQETKIIRNGETAKSPIQSRIVNRLPSSTNFFPQQYPPNNVPPGMQAVVKPKYFEAVEVPTSSLPQSKQVLQTFHKDYQRPQQSFGVQLSSDSELQMKIKQLEKELNQSRDRVKQLEKQGKIQIDEDLVRENTQLYDQLQVLTTSMQDEIQNQKQKHYDDLQQLSQQLSKEMEEQQRILTRQCEDYFKQYQNAEKQRQELSMKLYSLDANQKKFQSVNSELQDCYDKISSLQRELNSQKQKYNLSEEERIRQMEDLRAEYETLYNRQYEAVRQSADNKCKLLEEEIQKHTQLLDEAIRETEQWRSKFHQGDLDKLNYTQRISQLELQNLHSQKEIERLSLQNVQKQQEADSMRQRVNQLEFSHVQAFQPNLEIELRRIREQMEQRNKELDDLRNRNNELESYCIKMKETEVEFDILQTRYNQLEKKFDESSKYIHLYEQLILENESQKKKVEKVDSNLSEEKRNSYRFQQEIKRLNDLVQNSSLKLLKLRVKDEEFAKASQDYKKNMNYLQSQVNQFRDQYERELSAVYNNKNKSDGEFRESLERKFNLMKEELDSLRREREQLLQSCQQINSAKVQVENKLVILTGEIERLNQVLRTKYEEQQQLKENYRLVNEQLEMTQNQLEDLRNENDILKTRSRESNYQRPNYRPYESNQYSHAPSLQKNESHRGSNYQQQE